MAVRVTCPGCGAAYSLPDNLCGKNVRCTRCQQVFVGGSPSSPEEPLDVLPCDEPTQLDQGMQPQPGRVPLPRNRPAAGPPPSPRKGPPTGPQPRRSPLVWIVAGVAAALFVLCAGGLTVGGLAWYLWPRPAIDPIAVNDRARVNMGQPRLNDRPPPNPFPEPDRPR